MARRYPQRFDNAVHTMLHFLTFQFTSHIVASIVIVDGPGLKPMGVSRVVPFMCMCVRRHLKFNGLRY